MTTESDATPKGRLGSFWRGETAPMPAVRTPTRSLYPSHPMPTRTPSTARATTLALRVGTLLLAGGAPTEDVEAAVFATGTALGLQSFEVEITYRSITVAVTARRGRVAHTDMRVIRTHAAHHVRVAQTHRLVLDLSSGRVDVREFRSRLRHIEHQRRRYPRWLVVSAFGALSASITAQLGGGWATAAMSFVTAVITGLIGTSLARRRTPAFFINLVLGLTSTLIALGVTAFAEAVSSGPTVKPFLIIVGGIVSLLPGMALIVAAQEAMGSFAVTAAARFVELIFATIGIISGVLLGLVVGDELGVTITLPIRDVASGFHETTPPIVLLMLTAGIASAAAAVTYQSPLRLVVLGGSMGALGMGTLLAVDPLIDSVGTAVAVPAFAIGVASRLLSLRLGAPTDLVTVPGLVPLLPGLAVFRGLLALTQNEPLRGIAALVEAGAIAIALPVGALLGQFLAGRLTRNPGFTGPVLREGYGVLSHSR